MKGQVSKRRMLCGEVVALRPTLSLAARVKAECKSLEVKIAEAHRKGDAAKIEQFEREHAWLVVNSI
jgi:hypothetical protein